MTKPERILEIISGNSIKGIGLAGIIGKTRFNKGTVKGILSGLYKRGVISREAHIKKRKWRSQRGQYIREHAYFRYKIASINTDSFSLKVGRDFAVGNIGYNPRGSEWGHNGRHMVRL